MQVMNWKIFYTAVLSFFLLSGAAIAQTKGKSCSIDAHKVNPTGAQALMDSAREKCQKQIQANQKIDDKQLFFDATQNQLIVQFGVEKYTFDFNKKTADYRCTAKCLALAKNVDCRANHEACTKMVAKVEARLKDENDHLPNGKGLFQKTNFDTAENHESMKCAEQLVHGFQF